MLCFSQTAADMLRSSAPTWEQTSRREPSVFLIHTVNKPAIITPPSIPFNTFAICSEYNCRINTLWMKCFTLALSSLRFSASGGRKQRAVEKATNKLHWMSEIKGWRSWTDGQLFHRQTVDRRLCWRCDTHTLCLFLSLLPWQLKWIYQHWLWFSQGHFK